MKQIINKSLLDEYKHWLALPQNSKGKKYDGYDYYLNRLFEIAVNERVVREEDIQITDVKWLEDFSNLYNSSSALKNADLKNGNGGGHASLGQFIRFIKYKNDNNIKSSTKREELFRLFLEKCAEQSGKQKTTFLGYKSALVRWWERDAKQFSSRSSVFDYDDSEEFKSFAERFWKTGDSDSKQGINLYTKFLSENCKSKNGAEKQMEYSKDNKHELNLILYGPPGTGKTYNTIIRAVAIIDGDQAVKGKDYNEILIRYRKLMEEGRIAFTTFHQSYGYEEFIEGIKPDLEAEEIKYKREDGVFKAFCKVAREIKQSKESTKDLIKSDATVWKISLDSAGRKGFEFHDKCLNDSYIRVGWDSNEDLSLVMDDGKVSAERFIDDMEIGDIVLSCWSQSEIDGIGIIIGDYEWHETEPRLKRFRKVHWLRTWRGRDKYNIKAVNHGKNLSQQAVYRLQISIDDIIQIINDNPQEVKSTKIEYDYEKPYVFIIDEINRGNVSKIFGELITLIEPTKRLGADEEMKCTLPYSGDKFGVPKNVYILGTMNTADRSLVQLDAALRRRFAFEEMMPRYDVISKNIGNNGIVEEVDVAKLLETINDRITVLLDREHQIGHSYFLKLKENRSVIKLAEIFKKNIIPLLQEYFFDDYTLIEKVLSSAFIDKTKTVKINGEEKVIYDIRTTDNPQDYINLYKGKISEDVLGGE